MKRTVNFYHRLCISLQAYLVERYSITPPLFWYIIWRNSVPHKKIFGERRSPAFPLDYTTDNALTNVIVARTCDYRFRCSEQWLPRPSLLEKLRQRSVCPVTLNTHSRHCFNWPFVCLSVKPAISHKNLLMGCSCIFYQGESVDEDEMIKFRKSSAFGSDLGFFEEFFNMWHKAFSRIWFITLEARFSKNLRKNPKFCVSFF